MICPRCGITYEGERCPNGCKRKKPVHKKWWFWVLMGLATFITLIAVGSDEDTSDSSPTSSDSETTSIVSNEESLPENSMSYEEEIETYSEIEYEVLARNPDKYKGEKYKFTGEVIQVIEPTFGEEVELRINVTKKTYEYSDLETWSDTIYAIVEIPDGQDRILQDDIITIYGECEGLYSYKSVLGSKVSLPKIKIKYWEFEK